MKEFINRNKPVFLIGLATIVVFAGIILLSQKNVPNGPSLRKIENVELITPETYTRGSTNPVVQVVEFSDFECPGCHNIYPYIEALFNKYKDYISFSYRDFPLAQHVQAIPTAIAARAAGEQGKFWEYSEALYRHHPNFDRDNLIRYAEELGLNVEQFKKDLDDKRLSDLVNRDLSEAIKIGLRGTPAFIVNNNLVEMAGPSDLENVILEELNKAGIHISADTAGQEKVQESSQSSPSEPKVPLTGNVTQINYTGDGFNPNNLKLKLGDKVRFTNTTDKKISIRQLIESYSEFYNNVTLEPEQSFELVLYKTKLWTFKEDSERHYGSIYVSE